MSKWDNYPAPRGSKIGKYLTHVGLQPLLHNGVWQVWFSLLFSIKIPSQLNQYLNITSLALVPWFSHEGSMFMTYVLFS